MKGTRLVIPEILPFEMLNKVQEGNKVITNCSERLKPSMRWDGINAAMDHVVRSFRKRSAMPCKCMNIADVLLYKKWIETFFVFDVCCVESVEHILVHVFKLSYFRGCKQ